MTLRAWVSLFALAVVLAMPEVVLAQAARTQPPVAQPAGAEAAMPAISDLFNAVEQATSAKSGKADWSAPVKLAVVFALLAVLPSVLVMMTSFTRIIIVLGFIRRALTTQNLPPTVALVGLAIFLTLFTMSPTLAKINQEALNPYLQNKMDFETACMRGNDLLKGFMVRQTRKSDLTMFVNLARIEPPTSLAQVPSYVAIPAFAISEFRTAFEMGCLIFVPFLLVDLVVSAILLSAGMMMLPPSMISLPFKIILFVLVDGWSLLSRTLVQSFNP